MERIAYYGWPNCYHLSNEIVDLIITADVGPRIMRFGFINEENEFKTYEDMAGHIGGNEWRIYGGHRLVYAPEVKERTYYPDNASIRVEEIDDIVRLTQPIESTTRIEKEIDIRLIPGEAHVEVIHRIRNANLWAVTLAPWAVSVMAPGGKAIIPLPPRGILRQNFLPTSAVVLWAYTDMADPRWQWGRKYVMLSQDVMQSQPQKAGVIAPDGWVAYARNGHLFVKRFHYRRDAAYADLGCPVEVFTNADMLEIETLGPLTDLQPNAEIEHVEHWFLFHNVLMPQEEVDVDRATLPKIREATASLLG